MNTGLLTCRMGYGGGVQRLNQTAAAGLELVDLRRFEQEGSVAHLLCQCKALLLPEVKATLFDKSVSLSQTSNNPPEIQLNRGVCAAVNEGVPWDTWRRAVCHGIHGGV